MHDLRLALRNLARRPGFTAAALLTLALGIGANTAVFSVIHGVLLQSLPFPESDRLVTLVRGGTTEADISILDSADMREGIAGLEEIAAFMPFWAFDLIGEGDPEQLAGSMTEPQLFSVLGLQPLLGRSLTAADNVAGGERVAVISEGLWQRRFAADPAILGRSVNLSGNPWTVVGVMPDEADLLGGGVELWVPVAVEAPWALESRGTNNFEVVGRLAAGADLAAARNEVRAFTERLAASHPQTNQSKVLDTVRLQEFLVGDTRPALLLLLAAVGLVLLIACANLANLMLVQGVRRQREVATRLSLGAGRRRIARLFLTESVLLAVGGGGLGVLVAVWGSELLVRLAPVDLPRVEQIGIDPQVLAFTMALSLATGLLFGVLPALVITRGAPADILRQGGRSSGGRGHRRSLASLVAAEVAIALVLLIGCGLLLKTFVALQRVELGFEPQRLMVSDMVLPEARYGEMGAQSRAFSGIVEALEATPGVDSAAFIIGAPLAEFGAIGHSLEFDDRPPPPAGETPGARNRPVLGDYFRTAGLTLLSGRGIEPTDTADAPAVAVVNRSFADEFWSDEDPLGKRIAWRLGDERHWMTVVGVVADVRADGLRTGDTVAVYTSYLQRQATWQRFGTLLVAAEPDAAGGGLAERLREAVWSVDPALPVPEVVPMDDRVAAATARERFLLTLLGLFGAAALAMALQGLYGVLSFAVAQRRGEIGVRLALGAQAEDVVRLILRGGLLPVAAGCLVGLALAALATRLLTGLLYATSATDLTTYATVVAVLLATAFAACLLPALRASRVPPAEALDGDVG